MQILISKVLNRKNTEINKLYGIQTKKESEKQSRDSFQINMDKIKGNSERKFLNKSQT